MTKATDATPAGAPNGEGVARLQAHIAGRHPWRQLGIEGISVMHVLNGFLVRQAVTAAKIAGVLQARRIGAVGGFGRCQILCRTDPKRDLPTRTQPVGQAEVVGVHVGGDHPQNGPPLKRRGKQGFPMGACVRIVDAAIHHCPALDAIELICQQPQIDVVEFKRQGHAQPAHARGHLQGGAHTGQVVAQRVNQGLF